MFRNARLFVGITVLLTVIASLRAQNRTDIDEASAEALRRQEATINLRTNLLKAQIAEKAGEIFKAAQLYETSLVHLKKVGTRMEKEEQQIMNGMVAVRLQIAQQAQRAGNLTEADNQVKRILAEYPESPGALEFKKINDKLRGEMLGRAPSPEVEAKIPEALGDLVKAGTLVHDGKLLFETGRLDDAEKKLKEAIKKDPNNQAAFYYLNLIREKRHSQNAMTRDAWSREMLLQVDQEWPEPTKRDALPIPNGFARTNQVYTGPGRQMIYSKLDRIRFQQYPLNGNPLDGLPLSEVIKSLSADIKNIDPDKRGVNILFSPNVDPPAAAVDPTTGLAAPPEDIGNITIKISSALTDVTALQVLDIIQKVADRPIKYSVEDYAIVFSHKTRETETLHTIRSE